MHGVPFWSKVVYKREGFGTCGRASLYRTLLSTLLPPPPGVPLSLYEGLLEILNERRVKNVKIQSLHMI